MALQGKATLIAIHSFYKQANEVFHGISGKTPDDITSPSLNNCSAQAPGFPIGVSCISRYQKVMIIGQRITKGLSVIYSKQ